MIYFKSIDSERYHSKRQQNSKKEKVKYFSLKNDRFCRIWWSSVIFFLLQFKWHYETNIFWNEEKLLVFLIFWRSQEEWEILERLINLIIFSLGNWFLSFCHPFSRACKIIKELLFSDGNSQKWRFWSGPIQQFSPK